MAQARALRVLLAGAAAALLAAAAALFRDSGVRGVPASGPAPAAGSGLPGVLAVAAAAGGCPRGTRCVAAAAECDAVVGAAADLVVCGAAPGDAPAALWNAAAKLVVADAYLFAAHTEANAAALWDGLSAHPAAVAALAPECADPAAVLVRREAIDAVGFFDSVAPPADAAAEYVARLALAFGPGAVLELPGRQCAAPPPPHPAAALVAAAYGAAWKDWHERARTAGNGSLYMPFPMCTRPFAVPDEVALPPAPDPSPWKNRPRDYVLTAVPVLVAFPISGGVALNWGDRLNPVLASLLSDRPALHHKDPVASRDGPVYRFIGSGLEDVGPRDEVYGYGFINSTSTTSFRAPRAVHAVRGPLTAGRICREGGINVTVYGDPVLLLPLFHRPDHRPAFLCLVQHFREQRVEPFPDFVTDGARWPVRVLDIQSEPLAFPDALHTCSHLLTSSLHGLIAAHAYGIPVSWVSFSGGRRLRGDGFKFRDYLSSVGLPDVVPIPIPAAGPFPVPPALWMGNVAVDLYQLLRACPFASDARKEELVALARSLVGWRERGILREHAGARMEGRATIATTTGRL